MARCLPVCSHENPPVPNAFVKLRAQTLARATRPFLARGIAVQRCERCLLSQNLCICPWRVRSESRVDLVLLFHHDEIFKPTNTGRLIADVLPEQTLAFEWSRTQPDPALLDLLADPARQCLVIFPAQPGDVRPVYHQAPPVPADKVLTLILLDGTWKQASKMFRASAWLAQVPAWSPAGDSPGHYRIRQAARAGQLATAEAAALVLQQCGEHAAAQTLLDYFSVFHSHYSAMRLNRTVDCTSPAHKRLLG